MMPHAVANDRLSSQPSCFSTRRWSAIKQAQCLVIAAVWAATLAAPGAASQDRPPPSVNVEYDDNTSIARVTASIDILASPSAVYAVMIDCYHALRIVRGLESCRVIDKSGDGKWDVREHIISTSVFLPRVRNVFRSDYEQNLRIRFHRIDGDLRVSEGEWRLQPLAGGMATRVTYHSRLAFFLPIPGFLIQQAIRQDIPDVLNALRRESLASKVK